MSSGSDQHISLRLRFLAVLMILPALLIGCGQHTYHVVKRGDTLYSIGWWYNIDYHQLARWNAISPPYDISVGQRIFLADRSAFPDDPFATYNRVSWKQQITEQVRDNNTEKSPSPAVKPVNRANISPRDTPAPVPSAPVKWHWPALGRLVQKFSAGQKGNGGIKIAGAHGDMVKAAAEGKIVYTGDALVGYGKLIIIKHNEEFLSAYGHVGKVLVKEGDSIRAGQRIAEMGSTGTNRIMLHFEIRRSGVPVDPLPFLPQGDSSRG